MLLLACTIMFSQSACAFSLFGLLDDKNTPEQTITEFYNAMAVGDVEKASKLFAYPAVDNDTAAKFDAAIIELLTNETRKTAQKTEKTGGMAHIDIFPENNPQAFKEGSTMNVEAVIYFKDNFQEPDHEIYPMINTDEGWKIYLTNMVLFPGW